MKRSWIRSITCYLVVLMSVVAMVPPLDAGFIPSQTSPASERKGDLEKLQLFLETKQVRERLEQLGFSHEEVQDRVSRLNDQEIHRLAVHLDEMRVGGNGIGTVIGILLIIILVIVLVRLIR